MKKHTAARRCSWIFPSLTRSRLAAVLDNLRSPILSRAFSVDFFYTLAQYDPPPQEVALNSHVGPVTPAFAGWTNNPDRGLAAIVGLGYEEDKALGAVEHVQAVEIWTYAPGHQSVSMRPHLQKRIRCSWRPFQGTVNYPTK
jgi:hypothetical protein